MTSVEYQLQARREKRSHLQISEPTNNTKVLLNSNSSNNNNNKTQVSEIMSANQANKAQPADLVEAAQNQSVDFVSSGKSDQVTEFEETPDGSKHHVGPVMGIFFKVWSLVKVTRGRNHAKLRRQNSEEARQFEYLSGEQLAGGRAHFAGSDERGQFRRAGSQPAPSSSGRQQEPLSGLLQLQSKNAAASNSTSSGVSSTTSSTLANPTTPPSNVGVRRHVSTYSLRRATAELSGVPAERPKQSSSSWASKIKRSATTVNQTDFSSYVMRYRNRRGPTPQVGAAVKAPEAAEQSSASVGTRNDNKWPICGGEEEEEEREGEDNEEEEDEEDSNDIYSTPNDSIQSVTCSGGAPLVSIENNRGASIQQVASQAYPIIKSFSTSNFNQLIKQQTASNKFRPIEESAPVQALDQALKRQDSINLDSKQLARNQLNGSRFFISSSSSEDSNASPNQNQAIQRQKSEGSQHQPPFIINQHQIQPLQLKQSHHYHEPTRLFIARGQPEPLTATPLGQNHLSGCHYQHQYRKSPSLFEFSSANNVQMQNSRFSCKYPHNQANFQSKFTVSSFKPALQVAPPLDIRANNLASGQTAQNLHVPNSISFQSNLSNYQKQPYYRPITTSSTSSPPPPLEKTTKQDENKLDSEYRLALMLLESGANTNAKDSSGYTALMHAVLSNNLPAIKCLLEYGVDLDDTNLSGSTALDLLCDRAPTRERLDILKLLIDNRANLDRPRESDGSRLLDRLIAQHQYADDKLPFIECLLQNGAKLGSSTWLAANGKRDIQLRLLKKLCQDGYFLYKNSSIEAAVYRFEYALKRIAELEQQLSSKCRYFNELINDQAILSTLRQIKYQTYLGLSRCERKRKFYKRALEFAHMAILVDSTSYEAYYSKAHILKDLRDSDDALAAINQTSKLVEGSIERAQLELNNLQQQEDALVFDGCFNMRDSKHSNWIESNRLELMSNLEYMNDARKYIARLRDEIIEDQMRCSSNNQTFSNNPIAI